MDAVLLTGGCSDPLYRRASRVSMGTVFQIPWTYFDKKISWPEDGMKTLRSLASKLLPWHCGMTPSVSMIRSFMQKKSLPSFSEQKEMPCGRNNLRL